MKLRKIPVVLTYHSANYEHKKWGKIAKRLLRFSEKVALNTADKIIFVNKFQMEKFSPEIQMKSVYIPNGINRLPFSSNTNFLKKIGVIKNKYILSVGRITPEKGFDTLIQAYSLANKNGYKLVIAGGVEFENGYMEQLKLLSKGQDVIFTGYVYGEELSQLYSNASLFVLASNNEGFPLVLLEAMYYGLDVIVSDIPATHLVSLPTNDYFEKGNYRDLAEKMERKLINVTKQEYDLKKFDWNEIAKCTSQIFYETAGKSHD